MRRIFLSASFIIAISLSLVSCQKGDIGPEGPAGAAGPAGPVGPAGPTGTANVIYSSWFKFQATDWADSTVVNMGTIRRANKFTASITQKIVDNGLVMAYMKLDEPNTFYGPFLLPLNIPVTGGQIVVNTLPAAGRIVYVGYSIPSSTGLVVSPLYQYRYIVIPGGVAGKGETPTYNGYTAEALKSMSYEQIAQIFNLPAEGGNN